MKTYEERIADVAARIKIQKRKRRVVAATCLSLAVVLVAAVLMVPFGKDPSQKGSRVDASYHDLITKLETMIPKKGDGNTGMNSIFSSMVPEGTMSGAMDDLIPPGDGPPTEGGNSYVEVTDNQVAGVTESDIFKRTTEHIYYLRGLELSVYSIAGEDSALVGTYTLTMNQTEEEREAWGEFRYWNSLEMYLSQDCSTITVMMNAYYTKQGTCTVLVSLDVTDPANVVEKNRILVSGSYQSSRLVNGRILLMSRYKIDIFNVDFDDLSTFVPQVGSSGNMQYVAAEDIIFPDTLSHCTYTTVCILDEKTLTVQDTAACLSYSDQVYVSRDNIFVSRDCWEKLDDGGNHGMSEISCIGYTADDLEYKGSITLVGSIKDQYSMDEYNGVLRVVTSTFSPVKETDGAIWIRSASLYCVSLEDFSVVASVENFAPSGEQAQSVRFDGHMAYVCTAEVITLTDPVYFFDLSDLDNITWTDTGMIDGYSSSLIQLRDGYLLGIGYGDQRQLKIEVYMEEGDSVVSVCTYELVAIFSEVYKSYLIDREENLVGLAVLYEKDGQYVYEYLLLHFDGYHLNVVATAPCEGEQENVRADYIDGYLYVLSDVFAVRRVW